FPVTWMTSLLEAPCGILVVAVMSSISEEASSGRDRPRSDTLEEGTNDATETASPARLQPGGTARGRDDRRRPGGDRHPALRQHPQDGGGARLPRQHRRHRVG